MTKPYSVIAGYDVVMNCEDSFTLDTQPRDLTVVEEQVRQWRVGKEPRVITILITICETSALVLLDSSDGCPCWVQKAE